MKPRLEGVERLLSARHRDVRLISSLVIVALAGGMALLWPAVQTVVVRHFGPYFPSRFLIGDLLALVALFLVYLWRKSGQVDALVSHLADARGKGRDLEQCLAQARAVLQASTQLDLDGDAGGSLQRILQCVTEAMQADRGVIWRVRGEGRPPEREAVFPSSARAPEPTALLFEDEIARRVLALGATLVIDERTDLRPIGLSVARPRKGWKRVVAAPLVLDGAPAGALLLCDPDVGAEETAAGATSRLGLLEIFAGFAAGVLRNLRTFQAISARNSELERARKLLCDHQRELAEIDAVTTMTRVARSLAHGLSDPLTSIAGYADVLLTSRLDAVTVRSAREGLRREIAALKRRLQQVVEFTQSWRRQYGLVDLNQLVETAVTLQSEPMRVRGITCRFEPHPGLPYTAADPMRLRQVFLSLLAHVHGEIDEGTERQVRVRTLADAGVLRVHIDYPGRARPDGFLRALLDPRVEVGTLARVRNVDLPVAVSILRDHHGDLEIESTEGGRTRIAIELPILQHGPDTDLGEPDPQAPIHEVLQRIFGEDPAPPRVTHFVDAPAAVSSTLSADAGIRLAKPAHSAPEPRVPTGSKDGPPPAPPVEIAEAPADATADTPADSPAAEDGRQGLADLFRPGDLWAGAKPSTTPAVARASSAAPRGSLLAHAELQGALQIFDDVLAAEESGERDPGPARSDGAS